MFKPQLSSGEQPPALLHHVVDKNPNRLFTLLIFRLSRDEEVLGFNKDSAFFFPTFVFTFAYLNWLFTNLWCLLIV